MTTSLNINEIFLQVKKLDQEEQLVLLSRLASLLKNAATTVPSSFRLTSLSGLGNDIWKDTDIDQYIHEERQC